MLDVLHIAPAMLCLQRAMPVCLRPSQLGYFSVSMKAGT
ncbi:hypothetical protein AF72_04650 [Xylella taiwanensis]|uniref:Uncharacterized protein n=1 Tax=Xylella taiwanensis TaxID=1444770 RepID=Z9JKY2_9GAMM|nr:hypothetical protein AF72_04650 [Xylella taiwanensis]